MQMIPKTWLITGGAGYIGAHIADVLISAGHFVVIYDSLCKGLESRITYLRRKHNIDIPLIKGDIRNYTEIENVITFYKIEGIMHTAALKSVEESLQKAEEYNQVNYIATNALIEIAKRNNVKKFIFSSTAAVYGDPVSHEPCREDDTKNPISPYGESKYKAESCVTDFNNIPGNQGTSLRFFNVVGTAAHELIDNSVDNLIPIILDKINKGLPVEVYGTNYPTIDGTCVRDFVDVRDIAVAHLAAAQITHELPAAINIGTGRGASVREIIKMVFEVMNISDSKVIEIDPRPGDPAILCANINLAKTMMGFEAKHPLEASIRSIFQGRAN